jgi:uncharacterized protein
MGAALDAPTLREALVRYHDALEVHREEIDSLNVFPVPDGDTGTNMLLTQRSVVEALEDSERSLTALGEAAVRAALLGARGNSGVILSQILRGLLAEVCAEDRPADGSALARGLVRAESEARAAVATPVDGTILSVLRDAARAAEATARGDGDPSVVAEVALRAGGESLARTPDQLPELRAAGVVDAGGKGLVLLFDALVSALRGVPLSVEVGPHGPVGRAPEEAAPASRYGFEVMYLLDTAERQVEPLRRELAAVGDSVVVVGGGGLYNVHVHTDDPGAAVEAGVGRGRPGSIRITSLDEAVAERCLAREGRALRVPEPEAPPSAGQHVVAVVEGDGLTEVFRSLGVSVVAGGPGNNPSVKDLLDAVERLPEGVVFLLPNHKNVHPAATAAAAETSREVRVIPSRSVPQGLAAALAFSPEAEPPGNAARMEEAALECAWGALARAEREAETPAGRVAAGDWLGLAGEEVRRIGDDPVALAGKLVAEGLRRDRHELVTVYVGVGGSDEEAERIAAAVLEAAPGLEVEIHRGDQPRYPYLIGVE